MKPARTTARALAGIALAGIGATAWSANDVGTKAVVGDMAPAAQMSPMALETISAAFVDGVSPTQSGRIFRDGVAGTCAGKAYPGDFNTSSTYFYETFEFTNASSDPICVTIEFDPEPTGTADDCGTNAHISAYQSSYDPSDQEANYLGDVGSSVAQSFSFPLPGGEDVVLAVTNTSALQECEFAFSYETTEITQGTPALGLSATSLSFGRVELDGSATESVTITSIGTIELLIDAINEPGGAFSLDGGSCLPVPRSLAPGESCELSVTFAPQTAGEFSASLDILSNDANSPASVLVSGNVKARPIPTLSVWGMILLTGLMAAFARFGYRGHRPPGPR